MVLDFFIVVGDFVDYCVKGNFWVLGKKYVKVILKVVVVIVVVDFEWFVFELVIKGFVEMDVLEVEGGKVVVIVDDVIVFECFWEGWSVVNE